MAVYGTLLRGGSAEYLLRPLIAVQETDAVLPGTLFDTKHGYPALVLDDGPGVAAEVYRLADPATAFPVLDEYEGPEYEREVLVLPDGRPCWVYRWLGKTVGLPRLQNDWLGRGRGS